MTGEFEELVRDSMEWFVGNVRVPSDLVGNARRQRRRRLAARAAVAAGTAVACVAAVISVTGGASGTPRPHTGAGPAGPAGPAQTAAYVITRAEQAVSTRNLIMEISSPQQVITTEQPGHQPVRSFIPHSVRWTYHDRSRTEVFAAYLSRHGQPGASDTDTAISPVRQSSATLNPFTQTTVNDTDRTWSRGTQLAGHISGPAGTPCDVVRGMTDPMLVGELLFMSPAVIKAALACGGLSVARHVRVDGAAAIELTGTLRLTSMPLTVYVSPATYLLVRVVIDGVRQDYRWLAPTAAHLARLKVRIPPGFRRVQAAG